MPNQQISIGTDFAMTQSIQRFERKYYFPYLYGEQAPLPKKNC